MKILSTLILLCLGILSQANAQTADVIKATGGTDISIDLYNEADPSNPLGYVPITGPSIRETASGQLIAGETIKLTLPSGYQFNTLATVSVSVVAIGTINTRLSASITSLVADTLIITIDAQSESKGAGLGPGRIDIFGLEVGPTAGIVPDINNITNTGTTGPLNANYGDLSKKPGVIDQLLVETQADGNGQVVPTQNWLVGNSVTTYAIGRDKMGNYIDNVALQDESDWTLTNITGGVTQASLEPAQDLKSAVFSSQITGSAQIMADSTGLTTITPSEVIAFNPRPASELIITQQPPTNVKANETHANATIIELRDLFGNLVTSNSSTTATINITSGNGTLSGTVTQQAQAGILTFDDLSSQIAGTVKLTIQSNGIPSVTTNSISVDHNTATDLLYVVQPGNTAQNKSIVPFVELQLIDDFGNYVDSVLTVSVAAGFFKNSSTLSVSTSNSGKAIFTNLDINKNATIGITTISASFPGISGAVASDSFEIISAGSLAKFVIQTPTDLPLSEQTAGTPFDVKIRALDGNNTVYAAFTDTLRLTTNSQFLVGGSPTESITTPNFVNGVFSTTLTLSKAGTIQIFADNDSLSRSGASVEFSVLPTVYSADSSVINVDPDQITANGSSTSTVSAQLKDIYGNNLVTGGETVVLTTNKGSFSGNSNITATDQSNGAYTATLTSNTVAGDTAYVLGTINAEAIADTGFVRFIPGEVASFTISTPDTLEAGVDSVINLTAVDQFGNTVPSFNGTVTLSASNSIISSGSTVSFSNGQALEHPITLTKSGSNISIVALADNLFNVSGSSAVFTVIASDPSTNTSGIIISPDILQNDPTTSAIITLTLRDSLENRILTEQSTYLTAEQILLNGNPSSGDPTASITELVFNPANSSYTATITPGASIESIEITGYIGTLASGTAIPINNTDTLEIVVPVTWTAAASGPASVKTAWTNPDNWTSGVPDANDVVIVPNLSDLPVLNLNINVGSFQVDAGASLTLLEGNQIEVSGNLQIDGILDLHKESTLIVNGNLRGNGNFTADSASTIDIKGDISLRSFIAQTLNTTISLSGSGEQQITSDVFIVEILNVLSTVVGNVSNTTTIDYLNIGTGHSYELLSSGTDTMDVNKSATGNGTLILNNNTLVLRGNFDITNLDESGASFIFGDRENSTDYTNLALQEISNISSAQNVVVNNPFGVRTFNDLTVNGTLTLENGPLIISSGKSLIASNIQKGLGSIRMRRIINSTSGWRMLSAPLDTTFADFFDKTVTQGYPNSTLGNAAADSLQPNVLWYDAAYAQSDSTGSDGLTPRNATDNDRWRAPTDANSAITPGRGYFVYFFGSIASDDRYNTPLPLTLDIQGQEHATTNGTFNFPEIAYNEVSEGWNLIGNPFTASISWDNAGWTKTNVDNVVYAWDPVTNDYFYWNGIGGGSLDGTVLNNGIIKPMQAFWVKADSAGASLTLDTSAKTTDGSFLGKYQKNPESIGLSLSNSGMIKSTFVTFSPDGKTSKDVRDAFRLLPFDTNTYLEFYSSLPDGTELAINNHARDFGTEIEVPLHVGAFVDGYPLNGTFEISLHNIEDLPSAWTITLIDHEANREIDLKEETSYSFSLNQSAQKRAKVNTVRDFSLRNIPNRNKSSENSEARFSLIVSPGADADGLPDAFELFNNYPNPFNPSTTLEFSVPLEGPVNIEIYDILGRKVSTLVNANFQAGFHKVQWDASTYASGLYLAVFRAGDTETVQKLTLIK